MTHAPEPPANFGSWELRKLEILLAVALKFFRFIAKSECSSGHLFGLQLQSYCNPSTSYKIHLSAGLPCKSQDLLKVFGLKPVLDLQSNKARDQ